MAATTAEPLLAHVANGSHVEAAAPLSSLDHPPTRPKVVDASDDLRGHPHRRARRFLPRFLRTRDQREKAGLLMGSYVVLFTRYCIATFLSSFFATVSPGGDFTGTIDGLIFAAYPLGMACTSIFATEAIRRMGTRVSVYVGLVSTVILTLVFGLAPDMVPNWQPVGPDWGTSTSLKAIFFTSYFLNGLLGAFAETACLILVSARFSESSGAVMASVNTVCSLGCLLGPVVGGVLYDIPSDRAAQFRLPFLVCAAIPLALLPFIHLFIPQQYISGTEEPAASASAP